MADKLAKTLYGTSNFDFESMKLTKKIFLVLILFACLDCTSTPEKLGDENQIHSDKKYIHPKFRNQVTRHQFQIYRIHDEDSYFKITRDTNNQIQEVNTNLNKPNFNQMIYFLIKESENPDKPDLFDIENILLNGQKGEQSFMADYDHLLIKAVITNSQLSGKRERNHHIAEKIVPIKRTESTENLYTVPRKVSDKVTLIRSKRYIYQFSKQHLTTNSNQLRIKDSDSEYTFSFDHFDEI